MKALIIVASALALSLAAPAASATSLPEALECEGPLVDRVACTAEETVEALGPVLDPAMTLVGQELGWTAYMSCQVLTHAVGPEYCFSFDWSWG